jgi:uncharacterized protein (DUF2147 family)
MMKLRQYLGSLIFASLYLPLVWAQSPSGKWVTVDDKTGQKRALVTISETGGELSAIINKIYTQPGDTGICDKCPGGFKGKKISGLRFMWGLKSEGHNVWSGGSILDPKSGRIYRAKVTMQGNKLLVRGYLGMSLLGRTQVWRRE